MPPKWRMVCLSASATAFESDTSRGRPRARSGVRSLISPAMPPAPASSRSAATTCAPASVGADGVTYVVGVMLQGLSNASEAIINRMSVGVLLSPYAPVVLQQHNQRPNARAEDVLRRHHAPSADVRELLCSDGFYGVR